MKLGHKKTSRRILSGAASVAVAVSYLLPAVPIVTVTAAGEETKPLPTSFTTPEIVSVYNTAYSADGHQPYDSELRLSYTTNPDFVDFLQTMDESYISDAEGNPDELGGYVTNDYGVGYDLDFTPTIQVDFRVDGGDWHYEEFWDEDPYIGQATLTNWAYAYGEVVLFHASGCTDESHFLYNYADCFIEQTDGLNTWHVFDAENHTVEFRARLFARVSHAVLIDDSIEYEYYPIFSDWSETAGFGTGFEHEIDVPTALDAPVVSDLEILYEDESSGAPVLGLLATPSADVLADIAALEQYYGWVELQSEVSFDGGETWVPADNWSVTGLHKYQFSLYNPWYIYTNQENETYVFAGGEVQLRARYEYYLSAVLQNGMEYSGYQLYSEWSEPINIMIDGKGVYTLSVSHVGTGYTGYGTLTHTITEGAEIGVIDCPSYEGCYVASVSVNGEVVYTYDDPESCTVIAWSWDDMFYFIDPYMTQNLDLVITYDGTPTEQVDIRVSYTSDGGTVYPSGVPDEDNTIADIYVGVDTVYIGSDVTYSFAPNLGYQISRVLIDGVENEEALAAGEYTFNAVSEAHTVAVEFTKYAAYVSWGGSEHGTVIAEGYEDLEMEYTLIDLGKSISFFILPEEDTETGYSYYINDITITVGGESVSLSESDPDWFALVLETGILTLENLTDDVEVYVFFSTTPVQTVHINTSAGVGGYITESFDASVGTDAYVNISPEEGYVVDTVTVDGVVVENFSGDVYIFAEVTEDHTISVTFRPVQVLETYNVYISSVGNSSNCIVNPTGSQSVLEGEDLVITYEAAEGYQLEDILVNNVSIGADALAVLDGTYTLENITADVSVEFVFRTVTCTVIFQDWNGETLAELTCEYGSGVNPVDVNTEALVEWQDDGTLRFFSQWDKDYDIVYSDMIVTALYGTFKIDSMDITATEHYTAKVGSVDVNFNSVMALVSLPTRQFDESGARIYQEDLYDISADCYVTPATLEVAFEEGDAATISCYYRGSLVPVDVIFDTLDITYAPAVLMGDLNDDGFINSDDAVIVLKAYAANMIGIENGLTDTQLYCADVNYDGTIDTSDAVYILKYASIFMIHGSADWDAILNGGA